MSQQSHEYNTRSKDSGSVFAEELTKLRSDLLDSFSNLKDEVINLKDVIIKNLQNENKKLHNKVDILQKKIIDLEIKSNSVEQYGRRNNLEITGIPDTITDDNLETTVVDIFNSVNTDKISEKDIEACHRIGKTKSNSKKTIVRLVNRKHCKNALYNRKKLKGFNSSTIGMPNAKIFINENLTSYNNKLAYHCRQLKRARLVHNTYTADGIVHLVRTRTERAFKIHHKCKLMELYPDFDFENDDDDADLFVDAPEVSDTSLQSSY